MRLAAGKAALRQRIARRRTECAEAAARVLQPLACLDQALAQWRRIPPVFKLAALPLGLLLKRVVAPRARVLSTLLRWAPLVVGAAQSLIRPRR
jgi:hypothetical protein